MVKVTVGTKFHSVYMDSRAEWKVMSHRGGDVWNCALTDSARTTDVFTTSQIENEINHDERVKQLFADRDRADWWNSQTVGSTVHWHNSFGQYVRGVVVETPRGKEMRATALVGNWMPVYLPKRTRDGNVRWGSDAEMVRNGEVWRPNESDMWESPKFSRHGNRIDPTNLPEIDLSEPPAFEGEEAIFAKYENVRMKLTGVLSNGYNDPKAALEEALRMIHEVGIN